MEEVKLVTLLLKMMFSGRALCTNTINNYGRGQREVLITALRVSS